MKKYLLYVFIVIGLSVFSMPSSIQAGCSGGGFVTDATCEVYGFTWTPDPPCEALNGISKIICQIHLIVNLTIPLFITLGVLYFIWGVVHYVIAGGDEAKKKGKDQIIYGIIGLTVITGLGGLVNILVNTFGLQGNAPFWAALQGSNSTNCTTVGDPKFRDLLCHVTTIINKSVIPLIFSIAVAIFVWGVVQYVINSGEEVKKEKGRQFMLWGVIALTVMASVWGLVGILAATFGIDGSVIPQVKP